MSEKSKASEKITESDRSALHAMSELQKAGFGSLAWMGTEWMTTMSGIGGEVLRFVTDRIKEDVKTQHEILNAKGIDEVQGIQARFMKEAFDQYAAETGKLIEMSNDLLAKAADKPKG